MVKDLKIRLLDVSGKELFSHEYANFNQQEISLELQSIAVGYYFMQFETDGQLQTQKLVISK
jgi:hypothetical protein